jgi:hypothetical protein
MFAGFTGTMRRCDSLLPSGTLPFWFALPYRDVRLSFAPADPARVIGRPGVRDPVPMPDLRRGERRASQVPGEPRCVYAMFSDPGGTEPPGLTVIQRGPRDVQDEGSPRVFQISGLNRTALTLTVYASWWLLPACPRKTRFRLPASSTGWDWLPTGLRKRFRVIFRYISLPPFPGFAWRKDIHG